MSRLIAYILFLLLPISSYGQFRGEGNRHLSVDYMSGFVMQHKKQISHLITEHPIGFRVVYNRKSTGAAQWEQRYNYPDVGLSFIYIDYRNEKLGKSLALIPHYNIYLTKNREANSQWKYQIGLGIGYNTEKYDRVENNRNNVLGTDINFGIALQIQNQLALSEKWHLVNSISLTHFSNGSIKKPNSGINTISFNTGVSYIVNYKNREFIVSEDSPIYKKGLGYTATLSFGMHEATKIRSGSEPFFVVSFLADKKLNHKSKLGVAVEWFYSRSLKSDVIYDNRLNGERPDFNRIGLALSHELVLGRFSVMSQAGYYVYDPYEPFASIYLRAGLRRYFGDNLFSSLCVKSHAAKAEAAEFALGYRFK